MWAEDRAIADVRLASRGIAALPAFSQGAIGLLRRARRVERSRLFESIAKRWMIAISDGSDVRSPVPSGFGAPHRQSQAVS
jgi:hypothetical protein